MTDEHNIILNNGITSIVTIENELYIFHEPSYKKLQLATTKKAILTISCIQGDKEVLEQLSEQAAEKICAKLFDQWGYNENKTKVNNDVLSGKRMNIMLLRLCKFFPGWTLEYIINYPLSIIKILAENISYVRGSKQLKKSIQRHYDTKEEAAQAFMKRVF